MIARREEGKRDDSLESFHLKTFPFLLLVLFFSAIASPVTGNDGALSKKETASLFLFHLILSIFSIFDKQLDNNSISGFSCTALLFYLLFQLRCLLFIFSLCLLPRPEAVERQSLSYHQQMSRFCLKRSHN